MALQPDVEPGRGVEGTGEGFEDGLNFMMGVLAVERDDVDADPGFTGQGVEEVTHKVSFKGADGWG